ncbi:MAG: hypothetical protein J6T51_05120 [Kiritimatiellae bacterium]|nr:hypothetical protein [Kiritimatiellia bacterium]
MDFKSSAPRVFVLVMLAFSAFGGEVAQDEARDAVRGWAALQEALTGKERFSADGVAKVETYQGRDGRGSFHVVSFEGDDATTPSRTFQLK